MSEQGHRERVRAPWGHGAYLRLAWSELSARAFPDAIARIRARAPADARHATLELAWARLVAEALARTGPCADFEAFLAANPELGDPERVLRHYSRERIGLERARREFVLPDLLPLPALAPAQLSSKVGIRSEAGRDPEDPAADASHPRGTDRTWRTRP